MPEWHFDATESCIRNRVFWAYWNTNLPSFCLFPMTLRHDGIMYSLVIETLIFPHFVCSEWHVVTTRSHARYCWVIETLIFLHFIQSPSGTFTVQAALRGTNQFPRCQISILSTLSFSEIRVIFFHKIFLHIAVKVWTIWLGDVRHWATAVVHVS